MKFNCSIFLFVIVHFLTLQYTTKSFLDMAKESVLEYDSDSYRKEAASLNPEYYTKKGAEELNQCREEYNANFNRCSKFTTCNFCSANSDCGWCDEKKICIPIDLNSHNDMLEPLCQGDCIHVTKIEYCFKVLFEPANTQEEVNFADYPEVGSDENLVEHLLEKNFQNEKKESNHFNAQKNDKSLNYDANAYTNKPLSVDINSHNEQLVQDITRISKDVFDGLVNKNIDDSPSTKLDYKTDEEKKEEMMKHLKDFVPNFEFPQFVKSDLEDSIDKIKKEKMLLWLRGYSLNEDISKRHLPIYKNLTFVNEDQTRKSFLDKFYKDIVKDPYSDMNSAVYQNLIGEKTLSGEKINKNFREENLISNSLIRNNNKSTEAYNLVKNLKVVNSKHIDTDDLKRLVDRNNMRFKEKTENKKKTKTFKNISNELKAILKEFK